MFRSAYFLHPGGVAIKANLSAKLEFMWPNVHAHENKLHFSGVAMAGGGDTPHNATSIYVCVLRVRLEMLLSHIICSEVLKEIGTHGCNMP